MDKKRRNPKQQRRNSNSWTSEGYSQTGKACFEVGSRSGHIPMSVTAASGSQAVELDT